MQIRIPSKICFQLFVVVSQGLLAVILSGIQQDQKRHAWAIIRLPKPRIKPHIVCHRARDEIFHALSPFFLHSMRQKAGEEPGN